MGQIQDMLRLITSSDPDLETALLRCKVLAKRIGYQPLAEWAERELTGYPSFDSLPDYRRLSGQPLGTYTNGYWTYTNKPVDDIVVGDFYDNIKKLPIYSGVRDLSIKSETEDLHLSLTHALPYVNRFYKKYGDTYYFTELYIPVSPGMYEGVLSAVRSKLVDFLLEMEDIFDDDEDVRTVSDSQRREVDQAFTQVIHINQPGNVAIGNNNSIQDYSQAMEVNIQPGSINDLTEYLRDIGLDDADIEEIDPLLGYVYDGKLNSDQKNTVSRWAREKAKKVGGEAALQMIVSGLIGFAPAALDFLNTIPTM